MVHLMPGGLLAPSTRFYHEPRERLWGQGSHMNNFAVCNIEYQRWLVFDEYARMSKTIKLPVLYGFV